MTMYTFCINGVYKTVEADNEDKAIKEARIEEGDAYDLVEYGNIDVKYLLSAIKDYDILVGSQRSLQL